MDDTEPPCISNGGLYTTHIHITYFLTFRYTATIHIVYIPKCIILSTIRADKTFYYFI